MNNDIYERITNRMLELLEKGTVPWRKPWSTVASLPRNYVTEHEYRGVNALVLASSGFDNPNYMTFRQVVEYGGKVKKGSVGLPVVYWSNVGVAGSSTAVTSGEATAKEEAPDRARPILKYYTVFNAEQIEGVHFPAIPGLPVATWVDIPAAEAIFENWKDGPKVKHGRHQACYKPELDLIEMPNKGSFESISAYCSVRFHEMGHATGAPNRLNRNMGGRFGSKEYAKEVSVRPSASYPII